MISLELIVLALIVESLYHEQSALVFRHLASQMSIGPVGLIAVKTRLLFMT